MSWYMSVSVMHDFGITPFLAGTESESRKAKCIGIRIRITRWSPGIGIGMKVLEISDTGTRFRAGISVESESESKNVDWNRNLSVIREFFLESESELESAKMLKCLWLETLLGCHVTVIYYQIVRVMHVFIYTAMKPQGLLHEKKNSNWISTEKKQSFMITPVFHNTVCNRKQIIFSEYMNIVMPGNF